MVSWVLSKATTMPLARDREIFTDKTPMRIFKNITMGNCIFQKYLKHASVCESKSNSSYVPTTEGRGFWKKTNLAVARSSKLIDQKNLIKIFF